MSLSYFPPGTRAPLPPAPIIHSDKAPIGSPQERSVKLTNHGQSTVVFMVLNNNRTDSASYVVPGAGSVDPGRSTEVKIVLRPGAVMESHQQQFMFMSSAVQDGYTDRPALDLWAHKAHLEGEIHTHIVKVRCDPTADDMEDRSDRLVTSPSHHVAFREGGMNAVKLSLTNKAPDPVVFQVLITDSTIVSAKPNAGMIGSGWTTKVTLSCVRWERLTEISRRQLDTVKLRIVFTVLPRDRIIRRDDKKAIRAFIALQSLGVQYKTLTLSTDPLAGKPAVAHIEEAAADAAADNSDEDEEEETFVLCPEKIKREDNNADEATLVNFDSQAPPRRSSSGGLMRRFTACFCRPCACPS
ncbi:hypothetical protein EV121DRAFT_276754 [Schizophyllum commune]